MKKLLLISYTSPPILSAPSDRIYGFAKYLPTSGWETFLLTVANPFPWGSFGDLTFDHQLYRPLDNLHVSRAVDLQLQVAYHALKELGVDPRTFIAFDETLGWIPHAYLVGRKLIKKEQIDCILASHPPPSDLIIGSLLSMKCEIPLIVDYRDPWNSRVVHPSVQHRRLEMAIENSVLTRSNGIVTVCDGLRNMLLKDFPSVREKRIEVVRNGFHSEFFEARPYAFTDSKIRILYAGSIYRGLGGGLQPVLAVLEAVKIVYGETSSLPDKLQLILIGKVANEITDYVRKSNLGSVVTIMDPRSHSEVWSYMKAVQYLLNILHIRYGPGTKIYDYIAAGKPIINVGYEDGEAARLIAQYGLGTTVRPEPEQITNLLKRLLQFPLKRERMMKLSSFSRAKQTEKLAMFLNDMTEGRKHAS